MPGDIKNNFLFCCCISGFLAWTGQFSEISACTNKLILKTLDKLFEIDYNSHNEMEPRDKTIVQFLFDEDRRQQLSLLRWCRLQRASPGILARPHTVVVEDKPSTIYGRKKSFSRCTFCCAAGGLTYLPPPGSCPRACFS